MTFSLPQPDCIDQSRLAIKVFERDRKKREERRHKLSIKYSDPSLGPGMWP